MLVDFSHTGDGIQCFVHTCVHGAMELCARSEKMQIKYIWKTINEIHFLGKSSEIKRDRQLEGDTVSEYFIVLDRYLSVPYELVRKRLEFFK